MPVGRRVKRPGIKGFHAHRVCSGLILRYFQRANRAWGWLISDALRPDNELRPSKTEVVILKRRTQGGPGIVQALFR